MTKSKEYDVYNLGTGHFATGPVDRKTAEAEVERLDAEAAVEYGKKVEAYNREREAALERDVFFDVDPPVGPDVHEIREVGFEAIAVETIETPIEDEAQ